MNRIDLGLSRVSRNPCLASLEQRSVDLHWRTGRGSILTDGVGQIHVGASDEIVTILLTLTAHGVVVSVQHFGEFGDGLAKRRRGMSRAGESTPSLPNQRICSCRARRCEHRDQLEGCDLERSSSCFPRQPD